MALNLFRWICLGEDQQMLQQKIKWYILGTLVFTFTIDFLALGCTYYARTACYSVSMGAEDVNDSLLDGLIGLLPCVSGS